MNEIKINEIDGFYFGETEDFSALTGCTVIISEEGAVGGVCVAGGAPATRETDLLDPRNTVERVNAVVLSGGSAFGLEACSGVMDYLEQKQIGVDMQVTHVPIVCGASLFDLTVGNPFSRPDKLMGKQACEDAYLHHRLLDGNYGAGCGCSIGKLLGPEYMMKSGQGSCAYQLGDLKVGAVVCVNAVGNILENQDVIAGVLNPNGKGCLKVEDLLTMKLQKSNGNTTIGCIVTNAKLTKAQMNKLALIAHDAYAHCIFPVHTSMDGDSIFALGSGCVETDLDIVSILAVRTMEQAIYRAVKQAQPIGGLKAYSSLHSND